MHIVVRFCLANQVLPQCQIHMIAPLMSYFLQNIIKSGKNTQTT